ncbi:MAG: MFS transporter [Proteobacteria bacterium]|nr:MFS transporter [Pseudomonadota bacterium]MBU1419185.1 MFS transporter [Pseudomonadota bacterium]MBU1456436.1 MFS transporter [Pseudomonadota bacterium]
MKKEPINKKIYFAGLTGEIMEWFDFTVYGFFSLIIAQKFFPSDNHFVSLMATFATFAIGFVMRPLGAMVFGHIGDTFGRKNVLTISIFLMAFPSLIIGITPTFSTIGIFAPILLILMRMLQGISVGGEHTGSVVYLTELSNANNRAFAAVVPFVGTVLGVLLGSLIGVMIFSLCSQATILQWAWRIPFFLGTGIAFVGIVIRKSLPESYHPEDSAKTVTPMVDIFKNHLRPFIKVFFLNLIFASGFYTIFIYNPLWMQKFSHTTKSYSLEINSLALVVAILAMLLSSRLSNTFGRKPLLITATAGLTLFSYPLYKMMLSSIPYHLLIGQTVFGLFIGIFMGVIGVVMVELFDKRVRMSAVSVSFNLCFAIFGGTAPMVATWLIHTTHDNISIAWYLSAASGISLLTALTLPETYKKEELA